MVMESSSIWTRTANIFPPFLGVPGGVLSIPPGWEWECVSLPPSITQTFTFGTLLHKISWSAPIFFFFKKHIEWVETQLRLKRFPWLIVETLSRWDESLKELKAFDKIINKMSRFVEMFLKMESDSDVLPLN